MHTRAARRIDARTVKRLRHDTAASLSAFLYIYLFAPHKHYKISLEI